LLNSVKHIINGFLRIGKTLFEQRQCGVFLALQFHYRTPFIFFACLSLKIYNTSISALEETHKENERTNSRREWSKAKLSLSM